jgi:hypothetical protein
MRILAGALFAALLMFGSLVWGQAAAASTPILPLRPRLDTVYSAAEQTDPMPEFEHLCEEIGPRLTGSVAAQRAERQVLAHMREIGLQQVHSESWTLPRA